MTFGLATAAFAQNRQAVVAPLDQSTGPTVPGPSTITSSQTKGH